MRKRHRRLSATPVPASVLFSYALIFPQDEHERLLIERLAEVSVEVERRTELVDFENATVHVRACPKRPDGAAEIYAASFLAGCDGAHSTGAKSGRSVFQAGSTPISFILTPLLHEPE